MAVVLWICAPGEGLLSLGDWDTVLGKHYQVAACCVVEACLPYTATSCNQGKGWYQKCGFTAIGLVVMCGDLRGRPKWSDVQFCWWETVSLCFSVSGTITQKKKMKPCRNYLSTSFSFSLACMSGFSDLGQIKDRWSFPQG